MKWYNRRKREFTEHVAIDIVFASQAMGEHFKMCKARYDGYVCFPQENNIRGPETHGKFNSSPLEYGYNRPISLKWLNST